MASDLETRIGYTFRDATLLKLALTHRSLSREDAFAGSNQRLEFLGDAVLGLAVAHMLYGMFLGEAEGDLSKRLVGLVNGERLAAIAREMGLREALLMTPAERKRKVIEAFTAYFGPKAASPTGYLEMNWQAENFSGGGPTGHFPPGVLTAYGKTLRPPNGRVHWAGTETATVWTGYMEGAVRSGERAAQEVLAR